jgi:hypothetical protein
VHAGTLPESRRRRANDPFRGDRPLIGVLYVFLFILIFSAHFVVGWTKRMTRSGKMGHLLS